jgi:hypothetical protein
LTHVLLLHSAALGRGFYAVQGVPVKPADAA